MNRWLPVTCVVILVASVVAVVMSRSFPERIVAVPHADQTVTLDGRKMQGPEAIRWMSNRRDQRLSAPSWLRRDFLIETHLLPGMPCEEVFQWFLALCQAGNTEMKIAFEDAGTTARVTFIPMALPTTRHLGLIESFTPYQSQDQVRLQKDGTAVRFRWLGIRADGIVFGGKTLPLDHFLRDLKPQPNDCFIFVCQRKSPFEPVFHLQHLVEGSGCLPSALVVE